MLDALSKCLEKFTAQETITAAGEAAGCAAKAALDVGCNAAHALYENMQDPIFSFRVFVLGYTVTISAMALTTVYLINKEIERDDLQEQQRLR
ncbi:MAG: hypothetical protein JSR17_04210 [Proteobacteria bacterium]|nr:hypothetical protein [Pseudomonadota bacterium]